jgi:hypothetical protein
MDRSWSTRSIPRGRSRHRPRAPYDPSVSSGMPVATAEAFVIYDSSSGSERALRPRLLRRSGRSGEPVAVHAGEGVNADGFRARLLTLTMPGAIAEPFTVHLRHHRQHAPRALRLPLRQQAEVRDLGRSEERSRSVGACRPRRRHSRRTLRRPLPPRPLASERGRPRDGDAAPWEASGSASSSPPSIAPGTPARRSARKSEEGSPTSRPAPAARTSYCSASCGIDPLDRWQTASGYLKPSTDVPCCFCCP